MTDRSLPSREVSRASVGHPTEYQAQPAPPAPAAWDQDEETVDVRRYLTAIIRNKWIVLLGLCIGLIAGVLVHQSMNPVYSAQSTVWIDSDQGSGAGDAAPIRPGQLLTAGGWMDLMRSFTVLDPVVQNLRLFVSPEEPEHAGLFANFEVTDDVRSGSYEVRRAENGSALVLFDRQGTELDRASPGEPIGVEFGFDWIPDASAVNGTEPIAFSVSRPREVARGLYEGLDIQMQGTFMSVGLTGSDPVRTTRIVNGVVDRFTLVAEELKRSKFDELQGILEEQLEYAADNLEQAEFQLENFKVQTISLPSEQGTPVSPGLQQTQNPVFQNYFNLKVEQEEARRDRIAIERAMARSEERGRLATEALEIIPSVRESSDLMSALALASERRADLRALELRYTQDHPSVVDAREDVLELERQNIPALVSSLLREIDARLGDIDEFVGSATQELQQIPPRAVEETRLERQFESAENLFRDLQGRFENARLGAASTVPDVQVLDRAQVPETPSSDPRTRFLALAILAGIGLGLAGAVLRDRIDPTLRRPDQVTKDLGLPILGTIPHARSRNGKLRDEDHQQVVEAFRNLRLAVSYAHRGPEPMMVTVSSPGIGDGKSFTSSNLALAFAELGHRTLVIDGDVRRGTLHTLFGLDRRPGLTDFLGDGASFEEVVQHTAHETLWAITSGSRFRDGPELIGSPLMNRLLDEAAERFDRIIIDSPPLGAAVDPYVLSTLSGSMLLVLRNGATDQEVATTRLEELGRLPVDILGAVLNDVPSGAGAYKYYSYLPGYGVEGEEPRSSDKAPEPRLTAKV